MLNFIGSFFTKPLQKNYNRNVSVECFHSAILEHKWVLKLENPQTGISSLMPYAIFGYNHNIHSIRRDIIREHLDSKDPFEIDLKLEAINNY